MNDKHKPVHIRGVKVHALTKVVLKAPLVPTLSEVGLFKSQMKRLGVKPLGEKR